MTNERARKRDIRQRMEETGEPYSVAAKNIPLLTEMNPNQAFYSGLGKKVDSQLPLWVEPVLMMVTSSWDGDASALESLGQAYKRLEKRGHYFCHHRLVNNFFRENFYYGNMRFKTNALVESYNEPKMRDYFKKVRQHQAWVNKTSFFLMSDHFASNLDVLNLIHDQFDDDKDKHHDANNVSYNGILSYAFVWNAFTQSERIDFIEKLIEALDGLPPVEDADPKHRTIYNKRYPAPERVMAIHDIKVGSRVLFQPNSEKNTFTHVVITNISSHYAVAASVTDGWNHVFLLDWANFAASRTTNSVLFPVNQDIENNDKVLSILEDELDSNNEQLLGLTLGYSEPFRIKDVIPPADEEKLVVGAKVENLGLKSPFGLVTGTIISVDSEGYQIATESVKNHGNMEPEALKKIVDRKFKAHQLIIMNTENV
jgi:hypothetical protein